MFFIKYLLWMGFISFLCVVLFSIGLVIVTYAFGFLIVLTSKSAEGKAPWIATAARLLGALASFLYQGGFWALYGANSAALAIIYAHSPETGNPWLYYVLGFFEAGAPLGWLYVQETRVQGGDGSPTAGARQSVGTAMYLIIAHGCFLVGCFFPATTLTLIAHIFHVPLR